MSTGFRPGEWTKVCPVPASGPHATPPGTVTTLAPFNFLRGGLMPGIWVCKEALANLTLPLPPKNTHSLLGWVLPFHP